MPRLRCSRDMERLAVVMARLERKGQVQVRRPVMGPGEGRTSIKIEPGGRQFSGLATKVGWRGTESEEYITCCILLKHLVVFQNKGHPCAVYYAKSP